MQRTYARKPIIIFFITMTPNEKPVMTEFSIETAACSRVAAWLAKVCVTAPREHLHAELKDCRASKKTRAFWTQNSEFPPTVSKTLNSN